MYYSPEVLSKNIKKERQNHKWSQARLGDKLGVTGKQISNYENDDSDKRTLPPLEILLNMCKFFGCELGYLLGEEAYSNKTKNTTIVVAETGLTEESIHQIKTVMGLIPEKFVFSEEADSYQKMINRFISMPRFIEAVEELKKVDDLYSDYVKHRNEYDEKVRSLKEQLYSMEPKKANFIIDNLNSPLDCDDAFSSEELSIRDSLTDEELQVIHKYRELEYDDYTTSGKLIDSLKYRRYALQETISSLLFDLYPIDDSKQ
ncbi:MAG: helix-turn-helix transcriptional regulator [Ruminococcus sp.]|uniref:helix-turn-helix domain-containing protein n=1 Tax=Ruminococcus sp. TaxID=41978 RepID=UPI0026014923|nr:helix-turn-helix transcriptional regulator [Ruminococcus sp.]MBR5682408.1 helix-turn-helix transcriptional regulator [Ruminococcus sp.]